MIYITKLLSYLINCEVIWLTVELFYDVTKRCTNSIAVSSFGKVQTLVKDLGSDPMLLFWTIEVSPYILVFLEL